MTPPRGKRAALILAALVVIPFVAGHRQSQWDAYKPGTLAAIMEAHAPTLPRDDTTGRENVMVSGEDFPTIARLIYRGQSRPIDKKRAVVMREWSMTFQRDSSMLADFHREYLFQEGSRELWLPLQDDLTSFFGREVNSGQGVALYVIFLGARWIKNDVTWAFAVNEFRAQPIKK